MIYSFKYRHKLRIWIREQLPSGTKSEVCGIEIDFTVVFLLFCPAHVFKYWQSTVRPLQPISDWIHSQCSAQLRDWGWINVYIEKFLFIMTCARCFLHSVYYFIVFFTPEPTLNDGQGCRSIRRPHIKTSALFLPCFTKKSRVICHWFSPRLAFRLLSLLH